MDGLLEEGGVWVNLGPLNWRKEVGIYGCPWNSRNSHGFHNNHRWLVVTISRGPKARMKLTWEEIASRFSGEVFLKPKKQTFHRISRGLRFGFASKGWHFLTVSGRFFSPQISIFFRKVFCRSRGVFWLCLMLWIRSPFGKGRALSFFHSLMDAQRDVWSKWTRAFCLEHAFFVAQLFCKWVEGSYIQNIIKDPFLTGW